MDKTTFDVATGLMEAVAAGVFAVSVSPDAVRLSFANSKAQSLLPTLGTTVPEAIAAPLRATVSQNAEPIPQTVVLHDGWQAQLVPVGDGRWIGTLVEVPPPVAEARSLLSALFRLADIGMCVTAADRTFVHVNDAYTRLYDWPRESLIGRPFTMVLPEVDRAAAATLHDRYIAGETEESPGEWRVQGRNGRVIPVLVTAARMILPDGSRFKVTTVTDITALKDREAELIALNKRAEDLERVKSAFLANMSHELRTPLNAIIGFTDMMRSQVHGPIEQTAYREYLDAIHGSGSLLLSLVNDVLEIARNDASNDVVADQRTNRSLVDVPKEIRTALFMIAPEARKRGIEVFFQGLPALSGPLVRSLADRDDNSAPEEDLPLYYGNARSIRQVLLNLASNAIKFSPMTGTVRVTIGGNDGWLTVAVADEGPGLTADQIERLGEPFYRTDRAFQDAVPGTGLGLAVSKRLVEAEGGRLTFASPPTGGTVATMILPLPPPDTAPAEPPGPETSPA